MDQDVEKGIVVEQREVMSTEESDGAMIDRTTNETEVQERVAAASKGEEKKGATSNEPPVEVPSHDQRSESQPSSYEEVIRSLENELQKTYPRYADCQHYTDDFKDLRTVNPLIGLLHAKNIQFLRAKVLKYAAIFRAVMLEKNSTETEGPDASPRPSFKSLITLERFEALQNDLAQYSLAINNLDSWTAFAKKHEYLLKNLRQAPGLNIGQALAIQEWKHSQMEMTKQELDTAQQDLLWKLVGDGNADSMLYDREMTFFGWSKTKIKRYRIQMLGHRLIVAFFSMTAIMCPVTQILIHPETFTITLLMVLSILWVGVTLSCLVDFFEAKDIMTVTTAYAAILVIFFGTTTNTSG